jgi:hypothetical protein
LMSVDGKILAPPVYWDIDYFDEVSGLAMASIKNPDGTQTKGYIDKSGQFKIVVKKNKSWK